MYTYVFWTSRLSSIVNTITIISDKGSSLRLGNIDSTSMTPISNNVLLLFVHYHDLLFPVKPSCHNTVPRCTTYILTTCTQDHSYEGSK